MIVFVTIRFCPVCDFNDMKDEILIPYRVFSHDVTAAISVSQNNETAAMLVSQTSPVGVELLSYAKAFFCSYKFAWMLATWVKTFYISKKIYS